jgi:hypothetical protein
MSLATFKRKTANKLSSMTKRSGKPPGGVFLPQGPFGHSVEALKIAIENPSPVGFSINGGMRNIGYIGKDLKMSKQGTPFRGIYPYGSGTYGHDKTGKVVAPLANPVFNVNEVNVLGIQYKYIKPSVLSTYGMLQKKYRWAYYGKYPNYWVQPNLGQTTQSDTKSQGTYIHDLKVSNICVVDINNQAKYEGHIINGGGTTCHKTPTMFTYNSVASNAPYTKFIKQPLDASVQIMRIQRNVVHPPNAWQKPFPFATNGNTNSCVITTETYLIPPNWYINKNNNQQIN